MWELYVDGAARNNPGPAGAGVYILKDGMPIAKKAMYLGKKTNNQAEYLALLFGVYFVKQHMQHDDTLVIKADSQLMVRQVSGIYKIKNPELQRIYKVLHGLLDGLSFTIEHVMRECNSVADALANQGIDKKMQVPDELMPIWKRYEQAR